MTNARSSYRRRGLAVQKLLIIVAAIALVVAPVLVNEFPREVARWYRAEALEAELNQDPVAAVAAMDKAIGWNDSDSRFYLERASFKLAADQWQSGLEDCDRARQLDPDNWAICLIRSELLMHLNCHEAAIAELKELLLEDVGATPLVRAEWLNSLAYARAVGKRELPQGLEAIEESLAMVITRAGVLDPLGYLSFHRGYTADLQGEEEVALESLDEAVRIAEPLLRKNEQRLKVLEHLPRGQQDYAERVRTLRSHLAGILTLRASLLEKLEQPEKAARDRKQLDEMAPNGNLAVAHPMHLMDAVQRLRRSSNMLDTRGFLHYQLGDLPAARLDLQHAIAIADALCSTFSWQIDAKRYGLVDIRRTLAEQQFMLQAQAVMYYHQMLVHEALGMQEAAARDRAKVIELGCEPNEQLF